ncbi:SPASM domain-containing protein [Anaerococcus sp. AGMB09787]|uniref:SPASM domain-containing protein n=1 Tax=Anaerococcus sp. AGMB09787 TaxID=2922869 RepID=UPI001FAEA496
MSLDVNRRIHDYHRKFNNGGGTFDTIYNNLNELSNYGIFPTMIEGVYTRNSESTLTKRQISEYLYNKFKPKFIGISNVTTEINEYKPKILEDHSEDYVDFIFKKIENEEYFFVSDVYIIITMIMERKKSYYFCGAGINSIFINESGDIYPCQLFDENKLYYMGNIYNDNFEKYFLANNRLELMNKNILYKCNSCICKFWCTSCIGNQDEVNRIKCSSKTTNCFGTQKITELTLNKFTEIINEARFEAFGDNMENILYGEE